MTETASDDGAERPPYRLRLKELPADERPRERLKLRGAKSLSDSDLIAILLNTGTVAFRSLAWHNGWWSSRAGCAA